MELVKIQIATITQIMFTDVQQSLENIWKRIIGHNSLHCKFHYINIDRTFILTHATPRLSMWEFTQTQCKEGAKYAEVTVRSIFTIDLYTPENAYFQSG